MTKGLRREHTFNWREPQLFGWDDFVRDGVGEVNSANQSLK